MSDDDDCQIIENNTNYKSITCERIPELFLDKLIAKKHFSKYGKISRFILRPNRFCCTVDYEREEDATNALRNGTIFNGQEFDIRYSLHEVGHVQNTEEWVDPDVQAELDIMGNHARRLPAPPPKLPPPPSQSMSASRQVRQKPAKSQIQEPPTQRAIPNSVRAELEAIIRKPAYNDEEKYRILDARDKLIRLTTVRTTDIKKVVSIKGSCPDMCPEKERFMREFQHQVSGFEMEEGGGRNEMNHNIAIKEYSRSSADQEVPLAHELRPESTLKMTMQYLMHRIMGLCDIPDLNIGDWFHFVWDRTRSIRKDITQQELCSTGAVELVEQCARFHIHCAARLVAEDPSVFDQKINTENLTKCLQTLKYMYNDLRIKDIRCKNEAEFRGFIVLLNLNDANFLWELQDLPEEIQNSVEVRSAIAFYKCMESNNYVRFFNLVRKTSYMNACILLRYFTQVRLKATRMIIKAYNWPRHSVSLPIGHLVKILGFENEDAALDFFSYYGLQCDADTVLLDKKAFEQPDVPVLMDRAFEIVESKRQVGVGEAVCGSPLDSPSIFENHQLHNSFDANGYLRYESFFGEDQVQGSGSAKTTPQRAMPDKVFKVPSASPPMTPKQKLKAMFSNTSPKEDNDFKPIPTLPPATTVSESIFSQNSFNPPANSSSLSSSSIFKIPMPAPPVQAPNAPSLSIFGSSSSFQSSSEKKGSIFGGFNSDPEPSKTTTSTTTNIFGTSTQSFASDSIFQHFNSKPLEFDLIQPQKDPQQEMKRQQEKAEEEERLRRQRQEQQEITRRKEMEELERQRQIMEDQKNQKRLEEKYRRDALMEVTRNSERILSQLLDEVQDELLHELASIELHNHQCLDKMAENVISEFILDYIKQIHANELKIMRRDQSLLYRYFHTWRELAEKRKTRRELIATFPIWMTTDTLDEQAKKMAHPRQTENLQMIKRYRLGLPCDFRALLGDDDHKPPIDISSCLMRHFEESQNQLPTGFLKRRKYFKLVISLPGEREELPGFNSYVSNWLDKNLKRKTCESTPAFVCTCEGDLALCVRKVSGIVPMNEENQKVRKECDHAGGLIFMMAPGNLRNSRKRLHHLLKLSRIHQSIPVSIIIYNASSDSVESDLGVDSLVDDGKISSFQVCHSSDHNMKIEFQKSLRFLSKNDTSLCPLEAQSIEGFLNTCLGDELWQKLYKSWTVNPSFRKICSTPKFLIRIYNLGIQSLIRVIDEDFQDYPEFPEELRQFVPTAKFDIPVGLEQFPADWKNINRVKKLIDFLGKLKLPSPLKEELPQEIDDLELWLLNYTSACIPNDDDLATKAGYNAIKCLIEELNNESLQDMPLDQRLNWISWLPIVRQIAIAVMNQRWMEGSKRLPREVIYNRDEFMEFQSEPWWLKSESVKSVKMMTEDHDESANGEEEQSHFDIDSIIARAEKASSLADDKLKRLQKEATETIADPELTRELDETFYNFEVNEKCRSFEGTNAVIDDEEEDSLDQPPMAKKFKENTEREEMESTMERAFAILKKTEGIMDRYFRPLQQIQLEEDYV
ncbi:protein xmas [Episyrphus balteatus]|uniref:protein xmas n=1 Tax=Episyrphus balteatus TaxID=286459 RepID=UPI002485CCD8|nr:protein xmas [Episyrphus balteatus]